MISFKNATAALAAALTLGLVLSAAASPASAKTSANHPGHAARAQALDADVGDGFMSGARASALRECSAIANRFDQKTWGVFQGYQMRACMNEHGQME